MHHLHGRILEAPAGDDAWLVAELHDQVPGIVPASWGMALNSGTGSR
jgi:hypothetical protein